jgi:hypothetical protein
MHYQIMYKCHRPLKICKPVIDGVMVDYHTQKTNIIRDEVEGDIVVF